MEPPAPAAGGAPAAGWGSPAAGRGAVCRVLTAREPECALPEHATRVGVGGLARTRDRCPPKKNSEFDPVRVRTGDRPFDHSHMG